MKRYTAQEMRDFANAIAGDLGDNDHGGVEYFYDDLIPVIEALRQAADDMEREEKREKKYEYAEKTSDGIVDSIHEESFPKVVHSKFFGDSTIVRREVGEWEEVQDEEG